MTSPSDGPSVAALVPRARWGSRWFSLLWAIPVVAVLLAVAIAAAIWLRSMPVVQGFISEYPGASLRDVPQEFPWWLRWQHLLNVIFLVPIVRAGLQIWAGRPRLYWRAPGIPGKDWVRLQRDMPAEGGWSMRDDAVSLPKHLGIPGRRLSTGLARWWHLSITMFWVANGVVFYILLFATGQWTRIVPTTWEVFPQALSAVIQYASLDFPVQDSWVAYNGIQLLTYFVTVFIAAPLAVVTGVLQAPRIARRLAESRLLNVEVVRSLHALVLGWFLVFTVVHVTLVLVTGAAQNLNHITLGTRDSGWAGLVLFAVGVVVGAIAWVVASPLTIRYPTLVQRVGAKILGPLGRFY